jgi:hypothetical protein
MDVRDVASADQFVAVFMLRILADLVSLCENDRPSSRRLRSMTS